MKFRFLAVALMCLAVLTGCVVPEKFSAKVAINKDQSYRFSFDGTVKDVLGFAQMKGKQVSEEKAKDYFKKQEVSISKFKDVKSVSYKGGAVFHVVAEADRASGQAFSAMNAFTIRSQTVAGKKQMVITAPAMTQKDLAGLKDLEMEMAGTLEVSVPGNMEVVSHNATKTPTLGFGGYRWEIKGIAPAPKMVLQEKT